MNYRPSEIERLALRMLAATVQAAGGQVAINRRIQEEVDELVVERKQHMFEVVLTTRPATGDDVSDIASLDLSGSALVAQLLRHHQSMPRGAAGEYADPEAAKLIARAALALSTLRGAAGLLLLICDANGVPPMARLEEMDTDWGKVWQQGFRMLRMFEEETR